MPKSFFALLLLVLALPLSGVAQELPVLNLAALEDEELGAVTGREGIALSWEASINTDASGNPLGVADCPVVGGLTGGTSCRLGLNMAARPDAWIVLKGFRYLISQRDLYVDGANLSGTDTIYRDVATHMGGYNPNGMQAFKITIGNFAAAGCADSLSSGSCTTHLNGANYEDMTLAYVIESMTGEYSTPNSPGYLNNNNPGAPIAFRVASGVALVPDPDNPPDVMIGPYGNAPAKIRWDGSLSLHGF